MNIKFDFWNKEQEEFYWSRSRNNEFDGAFANGKTTAICMRAFTHLATFPKYAFTFCRQEFKALKATTMKTFFKICPNDFIHTHDNLQGYTVLKNKSFIYWMHLDQFDESDFRGLEINSAAVDQAEEIFEPVYNILDSRIGRWDQAIVPIWLLAQLLSLEDREKLNKLKKDTYFNAQAEEEFINKFTKWPRHPKSKRFLVHNYLDIGCNIADDEEFHWTYRFYNPASIEKKPDHFYIHRETDEMMDDPRTYQQKLLRDPEWVAKYVKGVRGQSSAIVHRIPEMSVIKPEDYPEQDFKDFLERIRRQGALFRILDHGDTGVTACGWLAILNGQHIFYKEYYKAGSLISEHRKMINEFSEGEEYLEDIADPTIFKKSLQTISGLKAGFYSTAMEYADTDEITDEDAPPITWSPADNNEFATRNRINELFLLQPKYSHPLTKVTPAPGLYFIKKCNLYPLGVSEAIIQTKNQKKLLLGSDNGRNIYSEERDKRIVDHAYDYVRYGVAMHNMNKAISNKKPKRMTFEYYNAILKRRPQRIPASIGE